MAAPAVSDRAATPRDEVAGAAVSSGETRGGRGPRRRSGVRRARRWLLLLGPLLVLAVGGYAYVTGGRYVDTENAYVKAHRVMVSAQVSGLVAQVLVHENQKVEAGDVLFRIDDAPYRIALSEAQARLAAEHDDIAALKVSYQHKREELDLARVDLAFARKEFERQSKLMATKAVSRSGFDAAEHSLDVARRRIRVAEQDLKQIGAQLGGDPDIPVERHPDYLAALAARDRAALDLQRTVVRAPFAGIAGNRPEIGQRVSTSSPVMSIVADTGVWIEANFKETELTHVRPGQSVAIRVDTYPDLVWTGTVQSLSPATGAEFSVIPPQNASGNWVKVVQRIPVRITVEPNGSKQVLRSGMSASVEIDTGHRRALPGFVRTAVAMLQGWRSAAAATLE